MLKVETIEIAGFASALKALRLPFGLEPRTKFFHEFIGCSVDEIAEKYGFYSDFAMQIDAKDIKLLSTLVKRGEEHAKVLRGIVVYAEIDAPRFWWQEMDTYRVGTERLSSASTMHIQGKGLSTEELVKMKSELTEGTMQKRVQMFSYQTLRRIYYQRKEHRLPHWHIFCDWIATLPFAKQLIINDK